MICELLFALYEQMRYNLTEQMFEQKNIGTKITIVPI